jgi:hypothetical protein
VAIGPERDGKKPYFKAFEHPFILINDEAMLHGPIWKEYGPDAQKTSKSGEPYPVFHWSCPVGYCPFVAPPAGAATKASPSNNKKDYAVGMQTRSRAQGDTSKIPVSLKASRSTAPTVNQQSNAPETTKETAQQLPLTHRPRPKRTTAMNANRARPGYCECCYERYSDLARHVVSIFHRQFALEDKNYSDLDTILGQLTRAPQANPQKPTMVAAPAQPYLLRSPVSQKSAVECGGANGSIGRNYTASKRAKQTEALKAFKPPEDMPYGGDNKENVPSSAVPVPTSPSCKRRRSTRIPVPRLPV